MEPLPDDTKIIDLLSKLKDSNGAYPSDILTSRRQTYLRQVANVGLGIGVATGIKNTAKGGNGAGAVATVTSKILETALIAAIVIEAGTAAYIYRDKIANLIRTYTGSPNIQEVASPSADTERVEITEVPSVTVTITPSGTVTVTITSGTPSAEVAGDNNNNASSSVDATPSPDSNGNQYGLTPKPVRTKDSNNNTDDVKNNKIGGGNGNNNSNNNKP